MKVGIFGGCFNPPHKKHLQIAKDLLKENYVDKIIYVPTGDYYNKKDLIKFFHRYNMLKIMTMNESSIEVSAISKSIKYQYTNQVLNYFQNKYKSAKIYFICGSDNILEFNTWINHEDIIKKYYLLIVDRCTIDITKLDNKLIKSMIITNLKQDDISSTKIRNELKEKKTTNKVDKKVLDYIIKNKLYM